MNRGLFSDLFGVRPTAVSAGLDHSLAVDAVMVSPDSDGDRCSDYEEFLFDTDRHDAAAKFRHEIRRAASGVELSFRSSPSRRYSLLTLEDDRWIPVCEPTGIPGTGGEMILRDVIDREQKLYAVEVALP